MPIAPAQTTPAADFLVKTSITVTYRNPAGIEEKKTLDAVFPLDVKGIEKPTFVLVNYLVPNYLRKTLGAAGTAWNRVYEIKIHKIINRRDPQDIDLIPVRHQTTDQLQAYCKKWELPVRPEEFHSVEYARQMVELYQADPKGYEVQYAQYLGGENRLYPELDHIRKQSADLVIDASLADEFETLSASTPTKPQISTQTASETTIFADRQQATKNKKIVKHAPTAPKPEPTDVDTERTNDPFSQM